MREQAKLDLGIIGYHQLPTLARHERGSDLPSELGANGDVLEIGIRRRETPGGRTDLIKGGVQTTARGIDQHRQGIHIRAFQFRELSIVQHLARDFVLRRQAFQNIRRGRDGLPFSVLHRRGQIHVFEQNLAELLR
jgi:hypothetical protein